MKTENNPVLHLPDLKEEAYRSFLVEQKCVFHPKTSTELIPVVDSQKLETMFGSYQHDVSQTLIPVLNRYIQMIPITDSFTDHHDRRAWRQTIPDPIRKYYENKNQLRSNNINAVCTALNIMDEFCTEDFLKQKCQAITREILCNFTDLDTEHKIKFVRQLEKNIREILKYLS